jgi:AcrR family transcriptional regulator
MTTARPRKRKAPRGPGRPAPGGVDLRERLLDAALECFAAEGMKVASLKSIAHRANVTPALVNYYFGSKQALQEAVFEERLMQVAAGLRGALDVAAASPRELAAGFVSGVHALVERFPWLPAIWVREILTEGGGLREIMLSRLAPMVPQALAQRFASAQRAGELDPGLEPRLLVVSLVGLTLFPLAAEGLWQRIFPDAGLDHARLRAHTLALLDHALEPRHAN